MTDNKAEMQLLADALNSTGSIVYDRICNDYTVCRRFWTSLKLAYEIGKLTAESRKEDWSGKNLTHCADCVYWTESRVDTDKHYCLWSKIRTEAKDYCSFARKKLQKPGKEK